MTILRDPDGERLFIEGRLEGIGVPELIHAICLPGRTGTLSFTRGEASRTIYVKSGNLVFASSTTSEDRLGETLLRAGLIGFRQLEEAVSLLGSGKRLGAILVELGHLSPENLVRGVLDQVREIILGLFPWSSGGYRFTEGSLPTAEVITLSISTPKLIYDGIRRITSWPRIARGVGSSRTTYRLTRDGRQIAEDLNLGAAERLILEMLEEPATVGDLCRGVFMPNFDVYQALWAFRILGIIRQVEGAAVSVEIDPDGPSGSLLDTPIGPLLVRLCRDGETGILYLSRDGEEKAIHIREGVVVFSTSNGPADNLTNFLLCRGVIGLRDRDEVERRLLSNKRSGTILREMGILSEDELVRFVREQLREIILSVFQWDRGEWRFVGGKLPTLEEITLDRPVEEWVLHGVRRVRDWARIRAGCGELDTVLRPAESPSAALAGIEVGPEESEVLAAVQVPRTVADICGFVSLPDYRVGQILWALQSIGAIRRAPIEALIPFPDPPALRSTASEVAAELFGREESRGGGESEETDVAEPARADDTATTGPEFASTDPRSVPAASLGVHEPDARLESGAATATEGPAAEPVPQNTAEWSRLSEEMRGESPAQTLPGAERARLLAETPSFEPATVDASAPAPPADDPTLSAPAAEEWTDDGKGRVEPSPPGGIIDEGEKTVALVRESLGIGMASTLDLRDDISAESATGPDSPGEEGTSAREIAETPEPSRELREEVERFNRRHREAWEVLRVGVGAGARNFVGTCVRRIGEAAPIFAGLSPDERGEFPSAAVLERLAGADADRAHRLLESLLQIEREYAGLFLDKRTVERLAARLDASLESADAHR